MIPVWLKPEQWFAVIPPLRGYESNRSPSILVAVAAQFMVRLAGRYLSFVDPRTNRLRTFCNIYVSDLTNALGCPIPHWVGLGKNRRELNANSTFDWLMVNGAAAGWRMVDELTARAHAEAGRPAVACWKNPLLDHPGHIAMLLPARPIHTTPATYITQAGAVNLDYGLLSVGFGTKVPHFFIHA